MTTNEIIKKFTGEYGYVTDIKGLVTFLRDENTSKEEINKVLIDVLKHNLSVDSEHKKSFEHTRRKEKVQKKINVEEESVEVKPTVKSNLTDVLPYVLSLKDCDDEDFLTELLPSSYDTNYDTIISSILLYLLREIQIAHEMMNGEDEEYLTDLINNNRRLIEIIKAYNLQEETEEETFEEHKNKIIFLRKSNGSLYVDSDIDEINDEEDMIPIIEDIEKNKMTREKRFYNYNPLKGISAIRRRDSRIIFTRLDNDVIVILGILVKRFQNTAPYREMLEARAKEFRLQKDMLKEALSDDSFIEEHQEILRRIKLSLTGKKKERKRDDLNG